MRPLAILTVALLSLTLLLHQAHSLTVVVTFPSLQPDIQQLLCPGDRVISLVPPSVDPHAYQLKPSNIQLLQQADLIISTGHVPFEKQIEELVSKGVIRAELIIIWKIPGIRILRNPDTGQPNLHMPIYDPLNYVAFIKRVATALQRLNPGCFNVYRENAEKVIERVMEMYRSAPRLRMVAVGDAPFTVYAVDWLGLHVEALLVPEPGLPSTPEIYRRITRLLHEGAVAVVTEPSVSKASQTLLRIAREAGAPVVYVPSPLVQKTIPEKLEYIVEQVERLRRNATSISAVRVRTGEAVPVWAK